MNKYKFIIRNLIGDQRHTIIMRSTYSFKSLHRMSKNIEISVSDARFQITESTTFYEHHNVIMGYLIND